MHYSTDFNVIAVCLQLMAQLMTQLMFTNMPNALCQCSNQLLSIFDATKLLAQIDNPFKSTVS